MAENTINPAQAIKAYSNMAKTSGAGAASENEGANFGQLLRAAGSSAIESMKASEAASARAVTGDANATEVMEAVTNADIKLNMIVAIRDRMVSAYQEIMRTSI